MTDFLNTAKSWIRQLVEVGLVLVPLAIVLQVLFGDAIAFVTGDVVKNLMALIKTLGDAGLIGLIALAIILWLFPKGGSEQQSSDRMEPRDDTSQNTTL